ncbi:MAG: 30S ribosomal protein S16 [Deltaproteobacteria bacterium]|nr:30S ribosomal protein S16 [Deltaproteobacteria bacterium]
MALHIRLRRMGAKKAPFYRIVVADSRSPREGRFVDQVGHYDPMKATDGVVFQEAALKDWIAKGAQPSVTVKSLMKAKGL